MSKGDYQIAPNADVGKHLEQMAAARGVSASELVTAMSGDAPFAEADDASVIVEFEAIWAKIESGAEPTVPRAGVSNWLATWGTDEFKPWQSRQATA